MEHCCRPTVCDNIKCEELVCSFLCSPLFTLFLPHFPSHCNLLVLSFSQTGDIISRVPWICEMSIWTSAHMHSVWFDALQCDILWDSTSLACFFYKLIHRAWPCMRYRAHTHTHSCTYACTYCFDLKALCNITQSGFLYGEHAYLLTSRAYSVWPSFLILVFPCSPTGFRVQLLESSHIPIPSFGVLFASLFVDHLFQGAHSTSHVLFKPPRPPPWSCSLLR